MTTFTPHPSTPSDSSSAQQAGDAHAQKREADLRAMLERVAVRQREKSQSDQEPSHPGAGSEQKP